jgi:DNA polymerase III delta subunit
MIVLRQLLFQRETPIGLIAILEGRFRQLLLFREALDNRWITLQPLGHANFKLIAADLPETSKEQLKAVLTTEKGTPLHPFVAGKLAGQSAMFTRPEIEERRAGLLAARRRMVSSATPETLILEYLVLKLCRPRAPDA